MSLQQPVLWRQWLLQLPVEERWYRQYQRAVQRWERYGGNSTGTGRMADRQAREWARILWGKSPTGPKIKLTRG